MLKKEWNESEELRRKKIVKIRDILGIVSKNLVEAINKSNMISLNRPIK